MTSFKTIGRIHSLDGQEGEITVLSERTDGDQKIYTVDYKGVKCTAIFNVFVNRYYVDYVQKDVMSSNC
ncbi:hypothetical protein FACS1894211_08850 [Clostridia bacterium]|nr:hypothetical protein FACS1894211_08850 [Clostridia bacterium]